MPPPSDDLPQESPPVRLSWRGLLAAPLNLAIVLGLVLVIAGLWWVTLQRIGAERQQALAAAMQANANLAMAYEQQVYRTLKAAEQVAAFVRAQYLRQGRTLALREWVTQRVIRESIFNIISVVDERGEIVSSSQATGRINYADRDFFRAQRDAVRDELFVNPPVFGRVSGRWQIPMSLRITRADGSFGGVVVMSVDPGNFTAFYGEAELRRQDLLELTGLDGVVRGRKIGNSNQFGMDAQTLAWFQRQRTAPVGEFIDSGRGLDDVARVLSYRSMADYPLMVTVGTTLADELAPVLQRRSSYLLAASGASGVLVVFAILLVLGLTRRRAAAEAMQRSEALFRATFHQAAMGIAHIAPDGHILRANEAFCRMLGYSESELQKRSVLDLSDPDQHETVRDFLADRLSSQAPVLSPEIEKSYRRKDGSVLWVCEALGVVRRRHGQPHFVVAVAQDITDRKALEQRLAHDAMHDALTGLPNRVLFQDRLARVLESARRHDSLAGVLYVDLDGFKSVNDTRGHGAGDMLLRQVAQRLAHCVRAEDTVARIGGDEFGVVLAGLAHAQDTEVVVRAILQAMTQAFDLADGGPPVDISASVGAALYPSHGTDTTTLLVQADTAMYAAKSAGKNRFSWATPVQ